MMRPVQRPLKAFGRPLNGSLKAFKALKGLQKVFKKPFQCLPKAFYRPLEYILRNI